MAVLRDNLRLAVLVAAIAAGYAVQAGQDARLAKDCAPHAVMDGPRQA